MPFLGDLPSLQHVDDLILASGGARQGRQWSLRKIRYAWSWALVRSAGNAGWHGLGGRDDQPGRRQFAHNA
jgi:hypothetical protein